MAVNLLTITKETDGYFTFTLNGDTVNAIKNTRNDLTMVGDLAHIKTSNGANLISEQNIIYSNITIVDGATTLVPTSPNDLFAKLISVGYFDWIDGGGTGGVNRFDELLDTFSYFGKDGQSLRVNESELKLETFTPSDTSYLDKFPTPLIQGKMLRVNAAGTFYEFVDAINNVTQFIREGYLTTAPSEDVVYQALALKANVSDLDDKLSNEDALKLYNGDKKIVKYVKKAVFSFIWDDVQTSDPLVYEVFQEFGYIPSYAITTNNLNSGNVDFYIDSYKKGCSILAHSVSHPDMSGTTLTNAQVNTQMVTSKNIIEGYGMRVSGWVTPSSTLNAIYYPQIDKNFGYAFTNTGGAFNETVSPLRLSRVGLESAMSGHNLANVQAIIDDAITNNKMVVFYGHHLPSTYLNPDTTPYLTETDLRNILTYLKTKSEENLCEVMTTDEAIQTYYGFSSGVEGNLVKWTGRNTQSNSIVSDDGSSAIVTGLFRTNGNVNLTYLPSIASASNGNVGSFNNIVSADGIASIINFNSPRSGGANASVYFGALNTSTDYRSITVLGRRTGLTTWLESARIDYDGRLLFGTQTNNGVDIAQFNGTVSGSNATLSNQFTTKAQLDLKQNIITNPVTGTGTTNFISKWSSSSAQANSGIFDNGTNIGFGESTIFNDYVTIKNGSPNLLGLYNSQDIATTIASGILSLGQMSSTTKIPAADISGFLAVVGNDTNGIFRIRTRRAGTMTEAVRVFASGGVSIGNTTDPGTANLSVTGKATAGAAATVSNDLMRKGEVDTALALKADLSSFSSASYTPTISSTTNVSSSLLVNAHYIKSGNIVTVTIGVEITPTAAATTTLLNFSLPVNRATTATKHVGSGVFSDSTNFIDAVAQSLATTTVRLSLKPVLTSTYIGSFSFMYDITQ